MSRHERFPATYQAHIQNLVSTLTQHIVQKSTSHKSESYNANRSLAAFLKVKEHGARTHLH